MPCSTSLPPTPPPAPPVSGSYRKKLKSRSKRCTSLTIRLVRHWSNFPKGLIELCLLELFFFNPAWVHLQKNFKRQPKLRACGSWPELCSSRSAQGRHTCLFSLRNENSCLPPLKGTWDAGLEPALLSDVVLWCLRLRRTEHPVLARSTPAEAVEKLALATGGVKG